MIWLFSLLDTQNFEFLIDFFTLVSSTYAEKRVKVFVLLLSAKLWDPKCQILINDRIQATHHKTVELINHGSLTPS